MTEFTKLGLSPTTLAAVAETGYTEATPIQAQAIPVALAGRDVLGIAQTGTGKTAAFTLPMIELTKGVDVLIATPGRLLDLFERGKMLLTGVEIMVVDEADRMLDMGFIPDIERIFKLTPPRRQTLFFSATMPPEITRLTTQFLKDPTRIEASRPAMTAETITQYLVRIPSSDPKAKRTALRALVARDDVKNGIVFCNRKSEVDIVAKSLKTHGFDAAPIHGDLDQSLRMKTLAAFRSGELKILVASDVAARGLDIPDVSHVFNYDVAHHADDYVHRIGRTGRAGRKGQTFMIVTPADDKGLDKVLKLIKMEPEELSLNIDWSSVGAGRGRPERPVKAERGERRGRGRKADAAPAETAPVAAVETPEPSSETPRRSRSRRAKTDSITATPAPTSASPTAEPRPEPRPEPVLRQADRESGRKRERERELEGVGFGGDIPAFLRRPAPIGR